MLDSWIIAVPIAICLGFLSGIGIGGGSLLILWLTMILKIPVAEARTMNLLFFIPSALAACCFRWRQGSLALKKLLPAMISGCVCALLTAALSPGIPHETIRKLFGGLLIITGIRELLYKGKAGQ